MVVTPAFWAGKRVALTGHTGFKGGWMALWLANMGAEVSCFALAPNTSPSLFDTAGVADAVSTHVIGDIRDANAVNAFLGQSEPEIVIHMAAQALVRRSYIDPIETLSTNIMGTAHILDACVKSDSVKTIINVTSDKCYQNNEDGRAFVEADPMGGHDVYSASKGAAELVAHSYQNSFFKNSDKKLASVRAGNVIGGGDWSDDRLVPDYFKSVESKKPLVIRSPSAVRPWQHVLEPVSGYLRLAEHLHEQGEAFSGGWNFGPTEDSVQTVQWIVDYLVSLNGGEVIYETNEQPEEAHFLALDSSKANSKLAWVPRWSLKQALEHTASWERERLSGANMNEICLRQIEAYQSDELR